MIIKKEQVGVGLIEVLVSLLLLSAAVLGFSTLQMTSVKATDEGLKRTQAMSISRGLSESLRIHIESVDEIAKVINVTPYTGGVTLSSCDGLLSPCSSAQIATKDALIVLKNSADYDIQLGVESCPNTTPNAADSTPDAADSIEPRQATACIVASWNTTNPFTDASTRVAAADTINCADENGIYAANADCIIVEAY